MTGDAELRLASGRRRVRGSSGLSRRGFLATMGAATGGAILAACAGEASKVASQNGSNIQLVYQDWQTEWFPAIAQKMLEDFSAAHPNIHVFFTQDPDNLAESMIADFEAGTAPDVFSGCCDFFPAWAQKGHLLDLRPFIEADLDQETINDWDPAQYQALRTHDGVQFGLPKYHGALALYYNKDMFDASKVEYPNGSWDHEDYARAMRLLAADVDNDGVNEQWGSMVDIAWERIQVHVNGFGGHFVDPENPKHSLMAEPEAMEAMTWVRDRMWEDRSMATFLDVQNLETRQAFIQQRIAMVEDGSWALKDILEGAPFRVGVTTFPAGPARKVTLATTDGFGIYAQTKHPEASWELLKTLVSKDYGRAMARAHLLQPARASLVGEWIDIIREEYPTQSSGMDLAAFAEAHLKGQSVTAEVFANMDEARRIAKAAWERIFTLGQAPVELMKQVSSEIEQAQQPGNQEGS